MQISKTNNINNRPSFSGLYRINYSENYFREIKNNVLPMYMAIRKEPATCFESNPLQNLVKQRLKEIAKELNYSFEWLMQNSKRNGIDLSYINDDSILVITKTEDMKKFLEQMETINKEPSFIQKLKNFFTQSKAEEAFDEYVSSKPEHLREVAEIDFVYKSAMNNFKKCLNIFNIVEVKTPQEMLQKMFIEK